MINLNKFIQPKQIIAPVLNGHFPYERKRYTVSSPDGWSLIELSSNSAKLIRPVLAEIELVVPSKNTIKGYTYNNNIVFQNFDVAKRKTKFDVMAPLHLNSSPTFSSIEAVIWEDSKLYFYRPNYSDFKISEVSRNCLSDGSGDTVGLKGVTPELKTVFLFHSIERQNIQKLLEEAKKKEKEEEFKKSIPGKLFWSFQAVGAKVLNYTQEGKRIVVDWSLGSQEFNSVIDTDTFRIVESGFCMSGDDKRHSISSMILTAKDYQKDRLIHKTRSTSDDEEDEW